MNHDGSCREKRTLVTYTAIVRVHARESQAFAWIFFFFTVRGWKAPLRWRYGYLTRGTKLREVERQTKEEEKGEGGFLTLYSSSLHKPSFSLAGGSQDSFFFYLASDYSFNFTDKRPSWLSVSRPFIVAVSKHPQFIIIIQPLFRDFYHSPVLFLLLFFGL